MTRVAIDAQQTGGLTERTPTVRLLSGVPLDGSALPLREHRLHYRVPPAARSGPWPAMLDEVERSGLGGRGGAAFPTAQKLRSVARRRAPRIVVANGAEGEPASHKDRFLLATSPHLVLDGAAFAAAAIGARTVVVVVDRSHAQALASVRGAVSERVRFDPAGVELRVEASPPRYVSGESSALVRWLNGGEAMPSGVHPRETGVAGRPTLVQNVETLAHLAQILNHGHAWFRAAGTAEEPGTTLVTVSGAVHQPSVVEVPFGTTIGRLVGYAGGVTARAQAVLIGGYFGTWAPAGPAFAAPFSTAGLAPLEAAPGAGVVIVLPVGACGLAETTRVLEWFASEGAGQCGPCVFGLPALANGLRDVVQGNAVPEAAARLRRWANEIEGRGACRHPDGATALLRSALAVFGDDLDAHAHGLPCTGARSAFLRVPRANEGWR